MGVRRDRLLVRPILLAARGRVTPALTFSPVPDTYSAGGLPGRGATFSITASAPVVWNWSATGDLPTSNVANGGSATTITFTLSNSSAADKTAEIVVSAGANSWTIELTASGTGLLA